MSDEIKTNIVKCERKNTESQSEIEHLKSQIIQVIPYMELYSITFYNGPDLILRYNQPHLGEF